MNKGYILIISLLVLISASSILSIKLREATTLHKNYKASEIILRRLQAEKEVFNEILYNLYIYDDEDFEYSTEYFDFEIKIKEEDINISVSGDLDYVIKLKYNDDCVCFIEILYE